MNLTLRPATSSADRLFFKSLLHAAFPADERRPDGDIDRLFDTEPRFRAYIALADDTAVGVISVWTLGQVAYIEHLATLDVFRGRGYGAEIVRLVTAEHPYAILEVEPDDNTLAHRRIEFYRRSGFTLQDCHYVQPSYGEGLKSLPMRIMTYGTFTDDTLRQTLDRMLHHVYGVRNLH